MSRTALYLRTLRHLRPAQVVYRVVLRAGRWHVAHGLPEPRYRALLKRPVPTRPGWPETFRPIDELDPPAPPPVGRRFSLVGEERDLGSPADWAQPGAPQLWRFHLHYFEWAWALQDQATFAELWREWAGTQRLGRGDAWAPYVVSLRAWNLCGVHRRLIAGTEIEHAVVDDLAVSAGYLRHLLERDVGGNHLVKNLKTLVGLGIFLSDDSTLGLAVRRLERELGTQVLSDGGHYERSPSYHCQVLGDLIDIAALLDASGGSRVPGLSAAIDRMRAWLGLMLLPDGDVPLFNDCVLVGSSRLALLDPGPRATKGLTVLQPSGYVVMRPDERMHLVADVGPPCPEDLPAHAHADCLSFELCVDGTRAVVDTGTSTYGPGPRRQFERSTAAHNTVEVDGVDQTEVWGAFRAARRANPRLEAARENGGWIEVTASHDGYERLEGRPRHRRTWRAAAGTLEIHDALEGSGRHEGVARLHLAADVSVQTDPAAVVRDGVVATGFGRTRPVRVLESSASGELPLRWTTTLTT